MLTRIRRRKKIIPEIVLVVQRFLILTDSMSVSTLLILLRKKILLTSLSPCSHLNVYVCAKESALAIYRNSRGRAVGGDIMLDRQRHTTGAQLFAGTKALRMHACTALLNMGNPASLI